MAMKSQTNPHQSPHIELYAQCASSNLIAPEPTVVLGGRDGSWSVADGTQVGPCPRPILFWMCMRPMPMGAASQLPIYYFIPFEQLRRAGNLECNFVLSGGAHPSCESSPQQLVVRLVQGLGSKILRLRKISPGAQRFAQFLTS